MATIYVRKAEEKDLDRIVEIIDSAKVTLKKRGVDQWQDGYPDHDILRQDLKDGITYLLIFNNEIVGTAALNQGIDENYQVIEDGEWMPESNDVYTVIHRIAVDANYAGNNLADTFIHHLITISLMLGYNDVRIDTHFENLAMQHVIEKNGFDKRGVIRMFADRQPRYAYQMILK
ncbi:GNAT family N-acetyltransferase [Lactobacillus sp. YT155]|uniref:GNAT family N-acetyltransferase n=1 Tax=Lactobacillus sp. YT155 TaxID=3060955 RepID=UPI00265F575E|nr:GNAT family N-acetyltransferase [Lactobacillus sp. YT155]MDO1605747.1 GNAT family N-acetyltransferase [Lactobacillus sp. YT155]